MTTNDALIARYVEKMNSLGARPSKEALPLSEDDLLEIERQLDIQLPLSYRLFLAQFNSYFTQVRITFFVDSRISNTVRQWLHFTPNAINVDTFKEVYWEEGPVPRECIVIATDYGDSPFCLVVRGEHTGEVRFLDYEEWGLDKPDDPADAPIVEDLPLVAKTFEDFIFGLYISS